MGTNIFSKKIQNIWKCCQTMITPLAKEIIFENIASPYDCTKLWPQILLESIEINIFTFNFAAKEILEKLYIQILKSATPPTAKKIQDTLVTEILWKIVKYKCLLLRPRKYFINFSGTCFGCQMNSKLCTEILFWQTWNAFFSFNFTFIDILIAHLVKEIW